MNDFTAPPAAPDTPAEIDARIAELTLMEVPTPQAGRARTDELLSLHQRKADMSAAPTQASQVDRETAEAFAPPASGLAYQFEQALPPGLEIADNTALGTLKGSLADAGVPAGIANGAFAHIASLHAERAFDTPQSEEHAVLNCRDTLDKVHGREAADQIVEDALAWMNDLARQQPSLREALRHARASPMAVMAAANLRRFGGSRGRR